MMMRIATFLCLWITATMFLARDTCGQVAGDKRPVPGEREHKATARLLNDIYAEDLRQARSSEKKSELAKMLLETARATKEDTVGQYVMLDSARELATKAGDIETVLGAVDEMDKLFAIDALVVQNSALTGLARAGLQSDGRKRVAKEVLDLLDRAMADEKFEFADKLIKQWRSYVRRAREGKLIDVFSAHENTVSARVEGMKLVNGALEVLAKNPTDPAANLSLGRYRCFVEGKWEEGIALLALGADAELKAVALKELGKPTDAQQHLELANTWWDWAAEQADIEQAAAKARSIHWYELALPGLDGAAKRIVEQRIQEKE